MKTSVIAIKYFKTTWGTVLSAPVSLMPFLFSSVLLRDPKTREHFHAFVVGEQSRGFIPGYLVAVQHMRIYYRDQRVSEDVFIAELSHLAHMRHHDITLSAQDNEGDTSLPLSEAQ